MLQKSVLSFDIEETGSNIECALIIGVSVTPTGWQQCDWDVYKSQLPIIQMITLKFEVH